MHNYDVLFEFFDGVPNHCASDRAIQAYLPYYFHVMIIIIMSSACGMADRPWPRLMSN